MVRAAHPRSSLSSQIFLPEFTIISSFGLSSWQIKPGLTESGAFSASVLSVYSNVNSMPSCFQINYLGLKPSPSSRSRAFTLNKQEDKTPAQNRAPPKSYKIKKTFFVCEESQIHLSKNLTQTTNFAKCSWPGKTEKSQKVQTNWSNNKLKISCLLLLSTCRTT